jgi:hypothetical protein
MTSGRGGLQAFFFALKLGFEEDKTLWCYVVDVDSAGRGRREVGNIANRLATPDQYLNIPGTNRMWFCLLLHSSFIPCHPAVR